MKALLLTAYENLEIASLPEPIPADNEILVQVEACGICGSDVHGYDGSSGRRIPPIVMGHEAAGTVVAIGPGVKGFRTGDRITFDSTVFCGKCAFCLRGQVNLCDNRQVIGVSCKEYRRMGAFAEKIVIPQQIAYPLPESLSFSEAALLEAVSVALHAVRISELEKNMGALVVGAGMIGILTAQAAHAAGLSQVMIADTDASRLQLAHSVGLHDTLHLSGPELTGRIMEITKGVGMDAVFEAVGKSETVNTAIDCVRKGGRVTLIGNITPEITLPLQKVVTREIRLQGSAASAGEYPQAIELIRNGKIKVMPLITAVAPLEEGPSWFARLHAREAGLMKVVLSPSSASGNQ